MFCQDLRGGLIDKPGKGRDYYHTCYALSGLSVAQYIMSATSPDDANVIGPDNNKVVSVQNRSLLRLRPDLTVGQSSSSNLLYREIQIK